MTRIDGFLVMEYNKKDAKLYQNKRIMKLGHHGSNTSSSLSFIHRVHPSLGIISSGKNNRYGHPHKETIAILKKEKVEILNTQQKGSIHFYFLPFFRFVKTGSNEFGIM